MEKNVNKNMLLKGINVCNPVAVEKEYLLYTVDYAIEHGFNHIQINGPIHDTVIGNIDGMTHYRKYSQFNKDKDNAYIEQSLDAINSACKKAEEHDVKIYVWHHELELPVSFSEDYPEVCNDYGDIEVSHHLVRDFLENKIEDFFHFYPGVDGIVLTLHETKVPLLKLKNQKLGKVERVKYVTQILYESCKALGKELIVRPFASIEEDYEMMTKAYEEISTELPIMDKWTQFDWSLTLPHNEFFNKIKKNPLVVETDIFGEYFGKGRLPIMLKKHLKNKFAYCEKFAPLGYVNRIDRAGKHLFGDVNEVNAVMTIAYLNGKDPDKAATEFFKEKYPDAHEEIAALMEQTEEVQEKTFYLKGYYFTELSIFPTLNHSKNHFYFEQMRNDCNIASNEWFIPKNWEQSEIDELIEEKQSAMEDAQNLFAKLESLQSRIEEKEYKELWIKFNNLKFIAEVWYELTLCFVNYVRYFETKESKYEALLSVNIKNLLALRQQGIDALNNNFYCVVGDVAGGASGARDCITDFTTELKQSFENEKKITSKLESDETVLDFIVCGGAMEGHKLMKEVNFSDTFVKDGTLFRIPGNRNGLKWSSINAHGWFSYELSITPEKENTIKVLAGAASGNLCVKVTVGDTEYTVEENDGSIKELSFSYFAKKEDAVRIRFDKISADMPCIYEVKVLK